MGATTMIENPIFFHNEAELPSRADALQNRADILRVARQLFDAEGVENVSMSQIARKANIGKGTLYRHFRSKFDLCHALLDDEQRAFQEQTIAYFRQSNDTTCQKLEQFVVQICGFTQRNLALLVEAVPGPANHANEDLNHPAHRWQWQTIVGLLSQTDVNIDVEYVADVIYVMLAPHTYHFQNHVRGYDHQRIVEGILNLLRDLTR